MKSYAWSTSPLRRYTDLVNQWQIIAAARHGRTAALAAPFKPKDAELFSIISGFDAAYSAYNGHQAGMERFWTLQLPAAARASRELVGTVFKEGLVRADDLPLVLPVLGGGDLPRGARVRVKLGDIDLITLDVNGTVVERLDVVAEPLRRHEEDSARTNRSPVRLRSPWMSTDTSRTKRGRRRSADNPDFVNLHSFSTLQIALGASFAVHAVLLTVRFVDPEGFNRVFQDTPLEVILVNARTNEKADKAQAIAQSLAGRRRRRRQGPRHLAAAALGAHRRSATRPKTRRRRSTRCRSSRC